MDELNRKTLPVDTPGLRFSNSSASNLNFKNSSKIIFFGFNHSDEMAEIF